jgi:tRNA pseudouridine38-40 synthase
MARYKLILAYDGTEFQGSQRQVRSRTVQGELEKALRPLGWNDGSVVLAGRTDAGVHATGQVAALDWIGSIPQMTCSKREFPSRRPGDQPSQGATMLSSSFDAAHVSMGIKLCGASEVATAWTHAWQVWPGWIRSC